ncbi:putative reverse transcriptase domain-containing protein [Tanacetum coccineum]
MQQPMLNPKDILDPTTALDMALVLMANVFKLNSTTPTNNNKRSSSNPCNKQITQLGMNTGQNRQMLMVEDIGRNQFRQYVEQIIGNQVGQNVNRNGNVAAAKTEGNGNGHNANEIRCYNCQGVGHYARNCTVNVTPPNWVAAE